MEGKRGRPKTRETPSTSAERMTAFRQRKRGDSRRVDVYLGAKASWRLSALAEAWECNRSEVIERLLLEADERYREILFTEAE